jgi:hypothetical protein
MKTSLRIFGNTIKRIKNYKLYAKYVASIYQYTETVNNLVPKKVTHTGCIHHQGMMMMMMMMNISCNYRIDAILRAVKTCLVRYIVVITMHKIDTK